MSGTAKIVCLILALGIGYAFVYPSFEQVSVLYAEKQKYQDAIATVQGIENRKNELLTQFNQISASDRKKIETLLPSSVDFVKLVSDIDLVASKYGISVSNFSTTAVDNSSGDSIEGGVPAKPYQSAIVSFSFSSSYESFNKLMKDLEKSLRILDVRTVHLSAEASGVYGYTVDFETYWLK